MSSRYRHSPVERFDAGEGVTVRYLALRTLPQPDALTCSRRVSLDVTEQHRLDLVAYRTMNNPLLAWKVSDANAAMDPFELTAHLGRRLRIPDVGQ